MVIYSIHTSFIEFINHIYLYIYVLEILSYTLSFVKEELNIFTCSHMCLFDIYICTYDILTELSCPSMSSKFRQSKIFISYPNLRT